MKKIYVNLNKITYVIYTIGMILLLAIGADGKLCLAYSLLLMTYSLVSEYFSFNVWVADDASKRYFNKEAKK